MRRSEHGRGVRDPGSDPERRRVDGEREQCAQRHVRHRVGRRHDRASIGVGRHHPGRHVATGAGFEHRQQRGAHGRGEQRFDEVRIVVHTVTVGITTEVHLGDCRGVERLR